MCGRYQVGNGGYTSATHDSPHDRRGTRQAPDLLPNVVGTPVIQPLKCSRAVPPRLGGLSIGTGLRVDVAKLLPAAGFPHDVADAPSDLDLLAVVVYRPVEQAAKLQVVGKVVMGEAGQV